MIQKLSPFVLFVYFLITPAQADTVPAAAASEEIAAFVRTHLTATYEWTLKQAFVLAKGEYARSAWSLQPDSKEARRYMADRVTYHVRRELHSYEAYQRLGPLSEVFELPKNSAAIETLESKLVKEAQKIATGSPAREIRLTFNDKTFEYRAAPKLKASIAQAVERLTEGTLPKLWKLMDSEYIGRLLAQARIPSIGFLAEVQKNLKSLAGKVRPAGRPGKAAAAALAVAAATIGYFAATEPSQAETVSKPETFRDNTIADGTPFSDPFAKRGQ